MFGIGTPELLVILVLALVVVGPERLPELGRSVGRFLREFRKVQDEVRGMVKDGIGDDLDDVRKEVRGTADELKRTSKEITGGVKEATDVKPLLPSAKRGPQRSPRSRSALSGLVGDGSPSADPPTDGEAAPPAGPADAAPEAAPPSDTAAAD
jgi:sec-independent protein translocase protein TatB